MICPIISFQKAYVNDVECYEMNCAWYCPDSKMCAIKKIALQDAITLTTATAPQTDAVIVQYLNSAT